RRRWPTSTCGPRELPVACPVRAGRSSSKISASRTSRSAWPSIPSAALRVKVMPGLTTCRVTPSSPTNLRDRRRTMPGEALPNVDIVIDCADPETLAEFWAEALGYSKAGLFGSYFVLLASRREHPPVVLQRVPEPK